MLLIYSYILFIYYYYYLLYLLTLVNHNRTAKKKFCLKVIEHTSLLSSYNQYILKRLEFLRTNSIYQKFSNSIKWTKNLQGYNKCNTLFYFNKKKVILQWTILQNDLRICKRAWKFLSKEKIIESYIIIGRGFILLSWFSFTKSC